MLSGRWKWKRWGREEKVRTDEEADLLSVARGEWEKRLVPCPPIIREEVLLETFVLVQLQRWRRQTNQKKKERGMLLLGNNETSSWKAQKEKETSLWTDKYNLERTLPGDNSVVHYIIYLSTSQYTSVIFLCMVLVILLLFFNSNFNSHFFPFLY